MAKKYSDETKLSALALISAGEDLKDIVDKLEVAYPTLKRWKDELELAQTNQNIAGLVDVDQVMLHRIAEETKQDLIDLASDGKDIAEIDEAIHGIVESIDGYNLLNTKLQTVALRAADRVNNLIDSGTGIGDLKLLVETLALIQNAFFNKPTTNINMLNQHTNVSNTQVNNFKGLKRA